MPQNRRTDLPWLLLVATLTLAFSSIPNWVGYAVQTEERSYKGIFFDPQDYAVHMSMLRAGMQGEWAYQFRFTTEPHRPAYTRLFYIVLGQVNRILKIDPAALFEIARWLFGCASLFAIYALANRIFQETVWRRAAFLLAVFGSGLGWLQLLLGWMPGPLTPIDFWLIDAYVFFGLALFPHFSFITTALCVIFLLFLDFIEKGGWTRVAYIIVLSILAQFVNPIALVLTDIALAAATLTDWIRSRKTDWPRFAALGGIATAQLPLLIYNFNLLNNDPTWSQFTRQNATPSPPHLYYLWGFGLLWPLALIGLISAIRQRNPALLGAAAWITTALILAYAPFAIQRRFLHGITIPLALLAVQGLAKMFKVLSQKLPAVSHRAASLIILITFVISLSSVYLILGRSAFLLTHPNEFYYPASLDAALTWLNEHGAPGDFVLSAIPSGQLIAQKTDLRVYIGHPMETLDFRAKSRLVEGFYRGEIDPGWLETTAVRWAVYGPCEQTLAGEAVFPATDMEIVYRSVEVIIYQVGK